MKVLVLFRDSRANRSVDGCHWAESSLLTIPKRREHWFFRKQGGNKRVWTSTVFVVSVGKDM